jgi:arylsulfatase A
MKRREFLKAIGLGAARMGVPILSHCADRRSRKPNIILVLVDDLGWGELGCYGNTFNETPNLDKLAGEGMRFTDAYAAAPVCSPTRAALLTGQYPARVGITDYLRPNDKNHLSTKHTTMAEVLKDAGYATGIIGKWHLTGYANHGVEESRPAKHGFDETIVSENRGIGAGSYFHPYHFNREIEKRLPGKEYLVDRMNLEAVEFINRHKDEPFFLYLSHYAVHTRLEGKEELVSRFEKKPNAGEGNTAPRNNPHLAAQLKSIDEGVGMIMHELDELGLAHRSLLVFTSDNGGEDRVTNNAPIRAGKSALYEGGIRVPLIARYPRLVPAGRICRKAVSTVDFYPTFCEAAGIEPDSGQCLDGVSMMPVLIDPKMRLKRNRLYWHYPLSKPHFLGGRSSGAIREGDWKLIEFFDTAESQLYNLADDIGERDNLAATMPDKDEELRRVLADWRDLARAVVPPDSTADAPMSMLGSH